MAKLSFEEQELSSVDLSDLSGFDKSNLQEWYQKFKYYKGMHMHEHVECVCLQITIIVIIVNIVILILYLLLKNFLPLFAFCYINIFTMCEQTTR